MESIRYETVLMSCAIFVTFFCVLAQVRAHFILVGWVLLMGGMGLEKARDFLLFPDAELEKEFVVAEGARFEALSIEALRIVCDEDTKKLRGEFRVEGSPFERGGTVKTETPCQKPGALVSLAHLKPGFTVHAPEAYKPELMLGQIDTMVNAWFGGLAYSPSLAAALDPAKLERAAGAGFKAMKFLCQKGVFYYLTDGDSGARSGSTEVPCQEPEAGPAPQLRIFTKKQMRNMFLKDLNNLPDFYVLATPSFAATTANALLLAGMGNDGRKASF